MARVKQSSFNRPSGSLPVASGTRTIGLSPTDPFFDDLQTWIGTDFPEEVEKAVFSTTFFAQQQMKEEFPRFGRSLGAPSDLQRMRLMDSLGNKRKFMEKPFYGADSTRSQGLGRAFMYKKFTGQGKAVLGWLSSSAAKSGRRWQDGGSHTVDQAYRDRLVAAQKKAGNAWPYKKLTKGRTVFFFPKVGKTIQYKRGGKNSDFFSHFFNKYEVAITNTLKRKIEEKMKITARGSSEVAIKADMNNIANGVAVQAYQYSQAMLQAVILRNLGAIV